MSGRGRVPVARGRGGPGLPVDRAVSQAAPVRIGPPVRAGVGVVPGRGDGQAGPGRVGRDEAARERLAAQGHELRADEREGEDPRRRGVELLAQAEAIDQSEDARFGKDSRGDELPQELRRRESRLAKIREAKQALEDEARERAEQEARKRAAARGEGEDTTAQRVADAVAAAVPKPKAQRNFTDPQSRIMKTSDGSFHQCFNAQAVVDDGHQVIVAAEVSDCAADVANLMPMTEQTTVNTGHAPGEVLADAGYCSADNLEQAATVSAASGTEFFIATGRSKHDAPLPAAPRGRIRKDATPRERMARKLTTKKGRTAYARRKVIVEPVFGQMATLQNAKHLLLRGIDGARGEWLLLAACHNLRKLHGHIGVAGLNGLRTA